MSEARTVETVVMPLSGRTFRWRSDGFFRVDEPVEDGDPGDGDGYWKPWEPDAGWPGTSEASPGETADPTWWLRYGFARPDVRVTAWRADDVDVPVTRLGHLWIAEWRSAAQPLFVALDDEVLEFEVFRPDYLPPARVPFVRTAPNPRG
ncbi:hypothetical protein SAMN05443575_0116 [Jatrophihabitans endophyticus]|uniref:Uncharacterized protein n=1 Tax=Jatrophihabitans endophyticus TaxID=1206085 RepID=A0A1M5C5Q4_9ACTN|nr:hypothetical protein [Jatrophihabitans endophyticus]SHF50094.1 hypothetical protein SAMN05443575_0116 [Jatrophihabitans endophyticus]